MARGRGFSPNFGEDELRWLAGCGLKSMGLGKKNTNGMSLLICSCEFKGSCDITPPPDATL